MESGSFKMEKVALEAKCTKTLSPDELSVFVGVYELPNQEDWLRTLTIRLICGRLYLDLKSYTALEMCPDGMDSFIVQPINRRLQFVRGRTGRVELVEVGKM